MEDTQWNYRVIMSQDTDGLDIYGLHEVYYRGGKERSWTENSIIGYFESEHDMVSSLEMMLKDARERGVLDMDKLNQKPQ